jgi:GT2 family glycosyltransferase
MLRISLVIPTVDRSEALYNVLRHLEHQTIPPHEILIIDQSAREDSRVASYAADHPGVKVHRLPERGLPNARNVGVRLASGDVVLFIDDDVIPDPGLVRFHAAAYDNAGVSGVGGRVVGGYDAERPPVGEFHPTNGKVVRNFGAETPCDVDHLPGGNMSFRREVFEKIGGFDTAFGGAAIGEETDFCLRARRAGFRLVFEPRASLEHLHWPVGGCRAPRFEEWLYWHSHNSALFALRHARAVGWPLFVLKRVARIGLFALEHGSPALITVGLRGLARGVATHLAH